MALNGALKMCAYAEETNEFDEIISTKLDMQVLKMPAHYLHGFKAVGQRNSPFY